MHVDDVAAVMTETRWHTAATLVVLPLLLVGLVTLAVLVFGAVEMALVTVLRSRVAQPRLRRTQDSPAA